MKKDTTTITRYIVFLVIVFVAWIFLFKKLSKDDAFRNLFKMRKQSLIIEIIDIKDK